MNHDLTGKSALITGAASGIGRAAALLFAEAGAKLVLADLSPAVEETRDMVRRAGGTAEAVVGDVAEKAVIEGAVGLAVSRHGGLHASFANAGIGGGLVPLLDQTAEEWSQVLRVNLVAVFLAVQASAKAMVGQGTGGSIVLTASVAGIRSGAGGSAYSASKAGVINFAATSANQLSGTGIRVNAICPGLTETGMTQAWFDGARARGTEAKLGQLNALKRAAGPEEQALVALFLASDASSYINGQFIAVDGGLSSSHPTVPGRMA